MTEHEGMEAEHPNLMIAMRDAGVPLELRQRVHEHIKYTRREAIEEAAKIVDDRRFSGEPDLRSIASDIRQLSQEGPQR